MPPLTEEESGEIRARQLIAPVQIILSKKSWKNEILHAVRQGGSRLSVH